MGWRLRPPGRCPECGRVVRITDTLTHAQWSDINCPRCGTKLIFTTVSRRLAFVLLFAPLVLAIGLGLVGLEFAITARDDYLLVAFLLAGVVGPLVAGLWFTFPYFHAVERWYPHCRKCRYDLRGTDGPTCPECGTDITKIANVK